jgi:hypothetical protein
MPTRYPNGLDNDSTLPRVEDNLTEVGGEAINAVRDAALALERSIGIKPQGNTTSLAERVNVSIDENGNLRPEALTLDPVVNSMVDPNAAIAESKLALAYSTSMLDGYIDTVASDVADLQINVDILYSKYTGHVTGTTDRHNATTINLNPALPIAPGPTPTPATNVQDALGQLTDLLLSGTDPHLDAYGADRTVKHKAAGISVNSASFTFIDQVTNTQAAFESIDTQHNAYAQRHMDTFHSNGVLKEIRSGNLYNGQQVVIANQDAYCTVGSTVVWLGGLTGLGALGVSVGDIFVVDTGSDAGVYQIRAIGPTTTGQTIGSLPVLDDGYLSVFHVFGSTATLVNTHIYKPQSVSSESAPLACSVRHNNGIPDTISVLNPNAARVVSLGFNGAIINGDGYDISIQVGLPGPQTRTLTITNLNRDRTGLNQATPVTSESVAERINAFVSDPGLANHFPISAFSIGDELAICHNLVGAEFTLKVLDGFTGNYALGLDAYGADVVGKTIHGNQSNSYVVDGKELNTIRTALTTTATETAPGVFTLNGISSPDAYGIKPGSVMHVTGHNTVAANGSYTIQSVVGGQVGTGPLESISGTFNVTFSDSQVSLADFGSVDLTRRQGIVQVAINAKTETVVHQRLAYDTTATGFGSAIELIDISETFPEGDYKLQYINPYFKITDTTTSLPGATVSIDPSFTGRFKLYHPNNVDYVLVKVNSNILSQTTYMKVAPHLVYDEAMVLCNAHFNGTYTVTNLFDTRLIGNMAEDQIRNDFIEVFTQRPTGELRSNGVVRGFDIITSSTFVDPVTHMQALPLMGGIAYVGGVRVAVPTQKALIQSVSNLGVPLSGDRVVGINEFGSVQAFNMPLGELLTDGYEPSSAYGKILPLYRVTLTAGVISSYSDVRLFIEQLDNKLDLSVDTSEYNFAGNFKSLTGALEFASAYPAKDKVLVRIVGRVDVSTPIVVPVGVSITGVTPYGGVNQKNKIAITYNASLGSQSFITLSGHNRIDNLYLLNGDGNNSYGALISIVGDNVIIDSCEINNPTTTSQTTAHAITIGSTATKDVRITNNKIDFCFSGIVCSNGCDNLEIRNNKITGVSGMMTKAFGINFTSATRSVGTITIDGNLLSIPGQSFPSDIVGIYVNVNQDIRTLRITNNEIVHSGTIFGAPTSALTAGIAVLNVSSTGKTVQDLFLSGNVVNGISFADNNVWGIDVCDCGNALVTNNVLRNIGAPSQLNTGCIQVGTGTANVEILNNTLESCDVVYGIYATSADTRIKISGNSLTALGTSADYITGTSMRAMISDNRLIGPAHIGINWSGSGSSIINNHLDRPGASEDPTDYAFSNAAINISGLNTDIGGNTIIGMRYYDGVPGNGSVGISNQDANSQLTRITNNSVTGAQMRALIELHGVRNLVSDNRLWNGTDNITTFISLATGDNVTADVGGSVETSMVTNNIMDGDGYAGIFSLYSSLISGVTFTGNVFRAMLSKAAFCLPQTQYCLISDNQSKHYHPILPDVIGGSGGLNTNTIGINAGMYDKVALPPASFTSGWDISSNAPHWYLYPGGGLNQGGGRWMPLGTSSGFTRFLYAPIVGLPNGAQIVSAEIIGRRTGAVWNASLNKSNAGTVASFGSSIWSGTSNMIFTEIITATPDVGSSGVIVDYTKFTYYVELEVATTSLLNDHVFDVRINFLY